VGGGGNRLTEFHLEDGHWPVKRCLTVDIITLCQHCRHQNNYLLLSSVCRTNKQGDAKSEPLAIVCRTLHKVV